MVVMVGKSVIVMDGVRLGAGVLVRVSEGVGSSVGVWLGSGVGLGTKTDAAQPPRKKINRKIPRRLAFIK
jgi:hypothetical protein